MESNGIEERIVLYECEVICNDESTAKEKEKTIVVLRESDNIKLAFKNKLPPLRLCKDVMMVLS